MLEVVEHQQRLGLAKGGHQCLTHRNVAGIAETGGAGHGHSHQTSISDRGQRGEIDPIGEVRADFGGNGKSERGLTDATGAGQREEANVRATQKRQGQHQLALAADERCEWNRQLRH